MKTSHNFACISSLNAAETELNSGVGAAIFRGPFHLAEHRSKLPVGSVRGLHDERAPGEALGAIVSRAGPVFALGKASLYDEHE